MGIEKVLSDNGITVLSFDEYKQKLNVLGYDINSEYVKKWECSNTWGGVKFTIQQVAFLRIQKSGILILQLKTTQI